MKSRLAFGGWARETGCAIYPRKVQPTTKAEAAFLFLGPWFQPIACRGLTNKRYGYSGIVGKS